MVKVIDNALGDPLFQSIKNIVLNNKYLAWYNTFDIDESLKKNRNDSYYVKDDNSHFTNQLVHLLYQGEFEAGNYGNQFGEIGDNSPHTKYIHKIMMPVLRDHNVLGNIERSKFNLLFPHPKIQDNTKYNIPHYDLDKPHYSILLYLNDSDGETIFFKEKRKNEIKDKLTELTRVKPKENRMVISEGNYHTSTNPINSRFRSVLNIVVRKD